LGIAVLAGACGGDNEVAAPSTADAATTSIAATSTATTLRPSPTTTEATSTTTTTAAPPVTTREVIGVWNRESDEHGSEFIRFGEDGSFAYADGQVGNLDTAEIFGSYAIDGGRVAVETSDCPGVTGTYTLRTYLIGAGNYLSFAVGDDACIGRRDGLTFGPWGRVDG